jgi:hypothetical protein
VDELTFRQLKGSRYHHPEITEVIFDYDKMLEMGLIAIESIAQGFDIVWDKIMFSFLWKYFQVGINLAEKQAKDKGIRLRLIVEITKENIDFIRSIKYHEIRHLGGTRGNFAILDKRAYMVQIFHNENEPPAQAFFSNSKGFVDRQQDLFNKLWEIAIPLFIMQKELDHQEKPIHRKILTDYDEIQNEINPIIEQSRRELLILSSLKILRNILDKNNFLDNFITPLRKGVTIKILTDGIDDHLQSQIAERNNTNKNKTIQFGCTNKLGSIDELVIINDSKVVLQIKYGQDDKLVAWLSNEEHSILVQEILFEKHWNEIKSLGVTNSN